MSKSSRRHAAQEDSLRASSTRVERRHDSFCRASLRIARGGQIRAEQRVVRKYERWTARESWEVDFTPFLKAASVKLAPPFLAPSKVDFIRAPTITSHPLRDWHTQCESMPVDGHGSAFETERLECQQCDKRFTRPENLARHMKTRELPSKTSMLRDADTGCGG